jgi:hypothetical protein
MKGSIPARERGDPAFEAGAAVQPLEHRQVRVRLLIVAVDARIGEPREHLVVAGIGKPEAVRDAHAAPARRVAQDLALAGYDRPDEGQQRLAPCLRRRTIETSRQGLRLADTPVFLRVERGVVAAEHLLPAEAVESDDEDVVGAGPVLGVLRLRGRRRTRQGQDPCHERESIHASCSSFIKAALSARHSASSRARVGATAAGSFAWPTSSR